MSPEKTGEKQVGRFHKGKSGNPTGRPRGTRNKTTLAALTLLQGEAEALTRRAIEAALGGDMQALKLCLERIISPARDRPISLPIPKAESVEDLIKISSMIIEAVAEGDLSPAEAVSLGGLIENHRKVLEIAEIEDRIKQLEMGIQL